MEEADKGIADFAQTIAGCVSFRKRLESAQVLLPDCQVIPAIFCVNDFRSAIFAVIVHWDTSFEFWHQNIIFGVPFSVHHQTAGFFRR